MRIVIIIFLLFFSASVLAQGVSINEDNSDPDPSAILEVKSTSKGMLIPRMTEAQRTVISSPATGLLVYQTDNTEGFWFFNGTSWEALLGEDPNNEIQTISKTGSTVTLSNGGGSFTDDNGHWELSGSNVFRTTGAVGIGTNTPLENLHLNGNFRIDRTNPLMTFFNGSTYKGYLQHFGNDFYFVNQLSGSIRFGNNGSSNQMIINNVGNVGIGLTTIDEELDVGGDVEVTGEYRYSLPRTKYYIVGCAEFSARNEDAGAWVLHGDQEYGHFSFPSGTWRAFATIHLPDGAVVNQVTVYYVDTNVADFTVYFRRTPVSGIGATNIGSTSSIENDASPVARARSFTLNETINNFSNRYTLIFESTVNDNTHRLYNVRIRYTIENVDF